MNRRLSIRLTLASVLLVLIAAPCFSQTRGRPGGPGPQERFEGRDGRERPHPPRGRHGRSEGERAGPVSPEVEQKVLEMLEQDAPRMHQKLTELKTSNPQLYNRRVRRIGFMIDEDRRHPELARTKVRDMATGRQVMELAHAHRKADSESEKQRIGAELRDALQQWFDIRQALREQQVKRLRERLSQAEEKLRTRTSMREKLIEEKYQEMTGGTPRPSF